MAFRIRLEKENFKFSCSHFTIFGPDSAEALHGHNYYITTEFKVTDLDPALGLAFDFNLVKPLIRELAATLDERVLIPTRSAYLKVEKPKGSIKVSLTKKSYEFSESDVLLLDLLNITSEELARYFSTELTKRLRANAHPSLKRIKAMSIGIEETRGQTVFFDTDF